MLLYGAVESLLHLILAKRPRSDVESLKEQFRLKCMPKPHRTWKVFWTLLNFILRERHYRVLSKGKA